MVVMAPNEAGQPNNWTKRVHKVELSPELVAKCSRHGLKIGGTVKRIQFRHTTCAPELIMGVGMTNNLAKLMV